MEETITKVRKYILENFLFTDDESELCNTDSFLEKGIIDSTGILELIAFIADEFHVTIYDDEIIPDNLDSIERVISYIFRKTSRNC